MNLMSYCGALLTQLSEWLTNYGYCHTLLMCFGGDKVSMWIYVGLCLSNTIGYLIIARDWSINSVKIIDKEAKSALLRLKWIFLLCAICGYAFPILEIYYPAKRLHIIFMTILNFYTWSYALQKRIGYFLFKYSALEKSNLKREKALKLFERIQKKYTEGAEASFALQNSKIPTALVKYDGTFDRTNKNLCQLLGYSEEEFQRLTWEKITLPEYISPDWNLVKKCIKGEIDSYFFKKEYKHKNKSIIPCIISVTILRDVELFEVQIFPASLIEKLKAQLIP